MKELLRGRLLTEAKDDENDRFLISSNLENNSVSQNRAGTCSFGNGHAAPALTDMRRYDRRVVDGSEADGD
eukprot:jgi/Bigna1/146340/aug1.112_g21048